MKFKIYNSLLNLILVFLILHMLVACSRKSIDKRIVLKYNQCMSCWSGYNKDSYIKKLPSASPDILEGNLDTIINSKANNCLINCIRSIISNQYFMIKYNEHLIKIKNYKKALNDYPHGSYHLQNREKDFPLPRRTFYERNPVYHREINFDLNFEFSLHEVINTYLKTDTFNRILTSDERQANHFLIFKVKNVKKITIYPYNLNDNDLERFNEMYFAVSEYPTGSNFENGWRNFNFVIIPLNPKFFDYKITLKNLPKFFISFEPSEPLSYVSYIRLFLTGQYSNQILSALQNPNDEHLSYFKDLTYFKSKGKYHYYAFYSEIYKKDMQVRLNTQNPEDIKVTTYKQ